MDVFEQTIANITGGDFVAKIIAAIIIFVVVGCIFSFCSEMASPYHAS